MLELFEKAKYTGGFIDLEILEDAIIFKRGKTSTRFLYTGLNDSREYVFKPEDLENKCCGLILYRSRHPFTLVCYRINGSLFCDLIDICNNSTTYMLK
jgi:hypothetical protein